MKLTKRLIALLLACLMFGGVVVIAADEEYDASLDKFTVSEEERELLYSWAFKQIDEYMCVPGMVIIHLKRIVSAEASSPLNKVYSDPDAYVYAIPELAQLDIEKLEIRNWTDPDHSTMLITLADKSNSSMKAAVALLYESPIVACVEVNGFMFASISRIDPKRKMGDIDHDDDVDNSDLIMVARHIVKLVDFDSEQDRCADINHDHKIDNSDLLTIAKMIVKIAD